jgi:hypothetical protein
VYIAAIVILAIVWGLLAFKGSFGDKTVTVWAMLRMRRPFIVCRLVTVIHFRDFQQIKFRKSLIEILKA